MFSFLFPLCNHMKGLAVSETYYKYKTHNFLPVSARFGKGLENSPVLKCGPAPATVKEERKSITC